MGLLDQSAVQHYIKGDVAIKDIHQLINEQLGSKYKVTLIGKKNAGHQLIGGSSRDAVLIEKNAYHRTFVYSDFAAGNQGNTDGETLIMFDGATLKWWLMALNKHFGIIGSLTLRLIYGGSDTFDKDIEDAIKAKHKLMQREINVGVSALWKKDKIKEQQ